LENERRTFTKYGDKKQAKNSGCFFGREGALLAWPLPLTGPRSPAFSRAAALMRLRLACQGFFQAFWGAWQAQGV
jgi:hypothetical protein